MVLFTQAAINGLVLGGIYVLMAVGFTFLFGVMRVVNFAHGEFYMAGAFVTFLIYQQGAMSFVFAVLCAIVIVGLAAAILERLLLRPLYGDEMHLMIVTLGIATVMQNVALMIFGPNTYGLSAPVTGMLRVGPLFVPWSRVVVFFSAILVFVTFWIVMSRTTLGRAMRALAADREVAQLQGISPTRMYPIALGIGVALAAAAGALMAPIVGISPFIGHTPMLKAFIIVVLGGIGSIPGAAVGGIIVGLLDSLLSTAFGSSVAEITQLLAILILLLVRPHGLLGHKSREA